MCARGEVVRLARDIVFWGVVDWEPLILELISYEGGTLELSVFMKMRERISTDNS